MAKPAKATQAKRQRELAKIDRKKEKSAKRAERKEEKLNNPKLDDGVDPDLVGIYPGPQPVKEDDY